MPVPGTLHIVNTLERFKAWDHGAAMAACARAIWADTVSGAAEARPQLLSRFLLLAHADLKTYCYCYWRAPPHSPLDSAALKLVHLSRFCPAACLQYMAV